MRKMLMGFGVSFLLLTGAYAFANSDSDCCKPGAACCSKQSTCCKKGNTMSNSKVSLITFSKNNSFAFKN